MTNDESKFRRPVRIDPAGNSFASARQWHRPVFIVFVLALAIDLGLMLSSAGSTEAREWSETFVFVTAAATTVVSLCRRLPGQNVLAAATVTALLSTLVFGVGVTTGIPFGPLEFTDRIGLHIAGFVPVAVPLLWIAILINGRGVARLILRPWRTAPNYGFRVIGLTMVLAVTFDLGLEPFAVGGRQWWQWRREIPGPVWFGTPWLNYFGWLVTALFILLVVTPWLIKKQPGPPVDDFHPLTVWLLLSVWIAAGNAANGFGRAASATIVLALAAGWTTYRGATKRQEIYRE